MTNLSLFHQVEPALRSKAEELRMYEQAIRPEDVWHICQNQVWQQQTVEDLPIHQIVRDILSITPEQWNNQRTTLSGNDVTHAHPELNEEELEVLLAPHVSEQED